MAAANIPDNPPAIKCYLHSRKANFPLIPPTRSTENAAGYHIYCLRPMTLKAMSFNNCDFAIGLKIPDGYYGQLALRSTYAKQGLILQGGVIDSDYRNSIGAYVTNIQTRDFAFAAQDSFVQIIILKYAALPVQIWGPRDFESQDLREAMNYRTFCKPLPSNTSRLIKPNEDITRPSNYAPRHASQRPRHGNKVNGPSATITRPQATLQTVDHVETCNHCQ